MWFRNIRAYRLTSPLTLSPEQLSERLADAAFAPCSAGQPLSLGWVPALGEHGETLVHAAGGRLLLRLRREEKLLPSVVVRELLDERIAAIEAEQGRKVYRKEKLGLKDDIVQDCLPRAFSRSTFLGAFIDTRAGWLFVDSASAGRAEELVNLLRECIGSFPLLLPRVSHSPTAAMTSWVQHRTLPDDIVATGDCELREPGDAGGVVRCKGVELPGEEVDVHLDAGKQVVRLAVEWDERVSLVLAEDLCYRRVRFADALLAENEDIPEADHAARTDADFALMADAVCGLQARVMDLFGGEATD
jgi:recombination associated protein RdgC